MILFLFTIVFIAQLIITAAIIIKLIDIDLAIIEFDEKLQVTEGVTKCSLYYMKEVTEAYKELVRVSIENFDKKMRKSNYEKIKTGSIALIITMLPKPYRKILNSTKWGFKIYRYLSTP